jgi:hypothetical protein
MNKQAAARFLVPRQTFVGPRTSFIDPGYFRLCRCRSEHNRANISTEPAQIEGCAPGTIPVHCRD